jgi:HSP20 family protein
MAAKDIVPPRKEGKVSRRRDEEPFFTLWKEVDRMFDDFARGFEIKPFQAMEGSLGAFTPAVDVKEAEKEFIVTAELPGMEEKDIDVSIHRDRLTISGEKKEEKEEKKKNFYRIERSFGSFSRVIPLPEGIESEKAQAEFKKGVLTVTLPKTKEAQAAGKKVPIRAEK